MDEDGEQQVAHEGQDEAQQGVVYDFGEYDGLRAGDAVVVNDGSLFFADEAFGHAVDDGEEYG